MRPIRMLRGRLLDGVRLPARTAGATPGCRCHGLCLLRWPQSVLDPGLRHLPGARLLGTRGVGLSGCDGRCIDPETDNENCGGCASHGDWADEDGIAPGVNCAKNGGTCTDGICETECEATGTGGDYEYECPDEG